MIRKTVYYSGRVQGVGFRWTTCRVAGGYEVTGTVRNLPDGRVEVIVEGPPEVVNAMLAELEGTMGSHIRDVKADTSPATGQYGDFRVSY